MSEPVLTRKQQRKSLSSMKGKKKVIKHLLATPDSLKLSKQQLNETNVLQLTTILKSLLPKARLPDSKTKKEATSKSSENNKIDVCCIKAIRSQLLLGVNVVSKAIKSETAACVLLADDIQPQLLIMHLLLLCRLKEIPYIFVPNFRDITKRTLGFSCIVLGFKKNFDDFLPAISFIKSLGIKIEDAPSTPQNDEIVIVDSTSDVNEINKEETEKTTFTYLYCDSKSKRAFIPESSEREDKSNDQSFIPESNGTEKSNDQSFIPLENLDENKICEQENDEHSENASITDVDISILYGKKLLDSKKAKLKKKRKLHSESKTDWFTHKKLKKCNTTKYSTSKIMKIQSNPNREKKKFKNLRKFFEC